MPAPPTHPACGPCLALDVHVHTLQQPGPHEQPLTVDARLPGAGWPCGILGNIPAPARPYDGLRQLVAGQHHQALLDAMTLLAFTN